MNNNCTIGPHGRWRRPIWERFWEKVDRGGDCWLWTASVDRRGYGQFMVERKPDLKYLIRKAHDLSFEYAYGPRHRGLVIDHTCCNPPCVNPAHLEAVTQGENVRRGAARRRASENA